MKLKKINQDYLERMRWLLRGVNRNLNGTINVSDVFDCIRNGLVTQKEIYMKLRVEQSELAQLMSLFSKEDLIRKRKDGKFKILSVNEAKLNKLYNFTEAFDYPAIKILEELKGSNLLILERLYYLNEKQIYPTNKLLCRLFNERYEKDYNINTLSVVLNDLSAIGLIDIYTSKTSDRENELHINVKNYNYISEQLNLFFNDNDTIN